MNNQFYLLNDNDILLFGKDTFIVEKIKEHLINDLKNRIGFTYYKGLTCVRHDFFQQLNSGYNIESKVPLTINQSSWNAVSEEIDCKLLKLGATAWKDGKLRFKANANYNNSSDPQLSLEVELEFCPNQPEQTEPQLEQSETLDDLRRKLETL